MAGKLGLSGGALGALAGLATVAAALLGWSYFNQQEPLAANDPAPPSVSTPPKADPAPPQAEANPAPAPEPEKPAAPLREEAKIDTFRQDLDGTAVLAGRAPGATEVSVLIGAEGVNRAPVDAQGRFATLFTLSPSDQPREMRLISHFAEGEDLTSSEVLIIAPSAPRPMAALAPIEETPAPEAPAEAVEAAEPSDPAPDAPLQVSSLIISEENVTVLRPAAKGAQALAFDSISYGDEGDVVIAGKAPAEATVRLYLDNALSGEVQAGADGSWTLNLAEVAPKLYQLRADQIGTDARVSQRIETPFLREKPELLASGTSATTSLSEAGTRVVTVQPGFTLWSIARETMGDGMMYVKVFEANRGQIRNPDLIYPGQVFTLPEEN